MKAEEERIKLTIEAEEYVVSMAMLSPKSIDRMSAICQPFHFFDKPIAEMWQLLIDLRGAADGISVEKIRSEMIKRGIFDRIGGIASFAKLLNTAPNPAHSDYYAGEVVRYWGLRTVSAAAIQLLDALDSNMADPEAVVQEFQAKVDGVTSSKDAGFQHFKDVSNAIVAADDKQDETSETPVNGIGSGIPTLDSFIGQFRPGKLYLLGGRTGKGKTALAANIATSAALSNKSVWFVSLEMQADEIVQRILSSQANMDAATWKYKLTSEERDKVIEQAERFSKTSFWFTDKSESFRSLKAKARLAKALFGLDLIVIDNLQLIKPMNYRDPKHERMKALTEAFKNNFAKELGVAVLLLAQLSVDAEGDTEPDNTSWADSKRIVDDADAAMILHRPSGADSKLILTKNRSGELGVIELLWNGSRQKFIDKTVPKGY